MTNFDKCKEMLTLDVFTNDKTLCDMIGTMRKCTGNCTGCYKWVRKEYKPQILDKAEKEYLSNIIRPFRDKVTGIVKAFYDYDGSEFIRILTKVGVPLDITLPPFTAGSMYKGMKREKIYTLKELGI